MLLPEMREVALQEQLGKPPWKRLADADRVQIQRLLQQAGQEEKSIRLIYYWQGRAEELLLTSFRRQAGVLEGITPAGQVRRLREQYIIDVQLVDWD